MTMALARPGLALGCIASLVVLTGCTGSSNGAGTSSATTPAVTQAPAAAPASGTCRDGQPEVASIAPSSISTNPSSWGRDSTMAKIKARGYLIVGTSGDAQLWGARNPLNGKIEGYDVDVAATVARALGLDPGKTVYRVLTLAQRVPALKAGMVDLVAERMTISCDRWQGAAASPENYANLSTAYYVSGSKLLVRTDSDATSIDDLKGQTVCGAAGSTSLAALGDADVKRVVVAQQGQCLVKFQQGEAVAIVGDDTTLAGFADQDPYGKVIGPPLISSSIGLGTSPAATDFTRFVNAVLEQMRSDGALARLYNTWMKPTIGSDVPTPTPPKPVYGRDIPALQRQS